MPAAGVTGIGPPGEAGEPGAAPATVTLTLPDKSSRLLSIRQDALVQPLSNP